MYELEATVYQDAFDFLTDRDIYVCSRLEKQKLLDKSDIIARDKKVHRIWCFFFTELITKALFLLKMQILDLRNAIVLADTPEVNITILLF